MHATNIWQSFARISFKLELTIYEPALAHQMWSRMYRAEDTNSNAVCEFCELCESVRALWLSPPVL